MDAIVTRNNCLPAEVQLDDLEASGACLSPLELSLPREMSLDAWCAIGRRLCRADQVMRWWLGDWAAFGLRKFEGLDERGASEREALERQAEDRSGPDGPSSPIADSQEPIASGQGKPRRGALKEFAEANGLNYQWLRNLAWVSNKVDQSRRRDSVDWSKHMEVAALPPKEQTKWLARAEKEAMPVAALRREIRLAHGEGNALESDGPVIKFAVKWVDDLMHWLRGRPAEFWTEDRCQAWRQRLGPVVDFYNRLGEG
jgi:hypothetical protein